MDTLPNIETATDGSETSRADYVYTALRKALHDGNLQSGQRLRENEIAGRLGVSRTPVREALRRLESDGLVVFGSPRGLMVAQLDQQQVLELYAVRETMEGLAARLTSQHASAAEIGALRDLLRREEEQASAGPEVLARLNRHFHAVIYGAAHNRYLLEVLNSIRDTQALLQGTSLAVPDRPADALREHLQIVNAIEARDPDTAETVARLHIRGALQARLSLLLDGNQALTF